MPDDGGLIEYLGIRHDEIYPVTDSEEIVCIELSSKNLVIENSLNFDAKKKQFSLLRFSYKYTLPSHINQFLNLNLRFQGDEHVDWNQIEEMAARDLAFSGWILPLIRISNQISGSLAKILRAVAIRFGARYVKRKLLRLIRNKT
jgi:hypothetical protein